MIVHADYEYIHFQQFGKDRNIPDRNAMALLPIAQAVLDARLALSGVGPRTVFVKAGNCDSADTDRTDSSGRTADAVLADFPVSPFAPLGHFYSPIVNPTELRASGFRICRRLDEWHAIAIDLTRMETFEALSRHFPLAEFPERPTSDYRYHYENNAFPFGDAMVLAGMIREFRPSRIIEVGAGYSSAVILDTLDRTDGMTETHCLFIEPNDKLLRTLLRPGDEQRVTILQQSMQSVLLHVFEDLRPGDFLLLDTTHIAKTGSDVIYEVFEILPRLASGVLVHFHDVFSGFEYPEEWIFNENRSWKRDLPAAGFSYVQ